ncbi:DUF1540 domain-containing protein [Sulfobacillus harzensis]|uniref:DUF1540 domain-containing protein n=1 Tax=Sulfobacillus harzensis TaxID=2729629 RepID=A0A7Y0L715_9FIRM|nr:DUF1540 domain-containing protein [Sulfobacillus harzensis]
MSRQVIHCTVDYCRYNEHRYCALESIQIAPQAPVMADGDAAELPSTFCASFEAKDDV